MNDESLDSLLRAVDRSAGAPPNVPDNIASSARTVVRQRQNRRQRATLAAALTGCYVAGLLTMRIWIALTVHGVTPAKGQLVGQRDPRSHEAPAESIVTEAESERVQVVRSHTSSELEEKTPYQLLCDFGDESFRRGAFESAIRYYRLALDTASEDELKIAYEQDNRLLASLKRDRLLPASLKRHRNSSHSGPTEGDSI
ncbi:MAG: hypothetical protein ACYTG0_06375 [Planctomycetota bacterium]|jgi:hypothetical protein